MSPRGRGANGELGHVLPLRNLLAGGKAAGGGLALSPRGGAWAKHGVTALYVGGWMVASSLLILLNKVILTDYGFPYPITLSGMGMLFSCLMSQFVVRGLGVESPKPEVDWEFWVKKILPIGFLAALALTFGNMAYLSLSVSFIQMLKSFTPVMTLVLSLLAGLEQRNNYLFLSVTVICLGMMIAAFGEIAFTVTGFTHMMLSQSSEASKLVASQVLLSKLKFSKWQVM